MDFISTKATELKLSKDEVVETTYNKGPMAHCSALEGLSLGVHMIKHLLLAAIYEYLFHPLNCPCMYEMSSTADKTGMAFFIT